MRNLKTYEGFFDFLKSKPSADDEIALEYIKRLKKVKGISPYKITFEEGTGNNHLHKVDKWIVDFEDTPVKLWEAISFKSLGFDGDSQILLLSKKFIKISNKEFIGINIICEGEPERCGPKARIAKELLELVKSVYENDKEAKRIERIKINMNDAADLIEDEPIEESLDEDEPEVQEIKDMCLELNDIGLRTKVKTESFSFESEIKIRVTIDDFRKGYRDPFNINDIKETLERIKDFMTENGYNIEMYIPGRHNQNPRSIRLSESGVIDNHNDKKVDYLITWCEMLITKINI